MTMKRILAMLLTLLMIVAVFAGCAGSGEVSEQSSTPAESSKTEESKADESSEPSGDTSEQFADIPAKYSKSYTPDNAENLDKLSFQLIGTLNIKIISYKLIFCGSVAHTIRRRRS